jgi:hydrogenase nickel incorporation protein HypA/HybF
MHELSLVTSIVETVTETLAAYPGARVKEVRLRVGVLASVIPESLEFCFEIASEGTPLEGAKLVVEVLPVIVHCEPCSLDSELEGVQSFRCPRCGELCGEIKQGRELEIVDIEIDEAEATA